MTLTVPSRRSFITGLISLVAAPAIVRVASLMPVKQMLSDLSLNGVQIMFDVNADILIPIQEVYWKGYVYWITGKDNVVHYYKDPLLPRALT